MAYNSKYTGAEVENLLDKASSSDASNFAICDSSGSAMIKKVTIEGFQLLPGVQVRIKFLNSATTSPMILNVNDTGSFACYYKGNAMHMGWCPFIADKIYTFTYDGETSWILEGDWDSVNKQDTLVSGTTIKTINGTSILGEGDISIPDEVELITISGDMLADEPTYTVTEAQAIIDAYNANKLIAIKCGTRINFGKGWFIPNINIRTQSGMSQIFLSGILGNYYIEHRIIYNTSAGTISASAQSLIDLSESGGSSEGGSSAYAEVNHGTSDSTFELTPNTFHVWDEVASLDLSLGAETSGVANEYLFQFTSGSTPATLTLPDDIKFTDDLIIEANKIYQISILKGLGSVLSWDNGAVSIFPITLVTNTTTDAGKQVYIELEKLGESGELEGGLLYVENADAEYVVEITTFAFDSTRNAYRLTFGMTSIFLDSSGYCYVIIMD